MRMRSFIAIAILCLATALAADLPPCFLSMGDWGYTDPNVASMSKYMQEAISNPSQYGCSNVSLTLALGDNFYNGGVSSVDDPLWETIFVNQFRRYPAFKHQPILATMGDHDYHQLNPSQPPNFTRAQAQIDYHYEKDPLWVMPDANYTYTQTFNNGMRIKFIMANTEALYACIHLRPEWCFQKDHEKWIEEELEKSDNDTSISAVIIGGHHAVVCPLGGHYDPKLDAVLVPIARRHRVSLIITGHSHFVAWSRESQLTGGDFGAGDLWYIINGAGRGAAAYPCWWTGLNMPVAKPINKECFSSKVNNDGAFIVHRVKTDGLEHCVVDSLSGAIVQCQPTKYRKQGAAPPAPETPAPQAPMPPAPPAPTLPPGPPSAGCPACTATQCGEFNCPTEDPFTCTAGAAHGGCRSSSWVGVPGCTSCCDSSACVRGDDVRLR